MTDFKPGQKVRVKKSLIMYHHPKHKNSPYDMEGLEGEIKGDISEREGVRLSATKPFVVQFANPKFVAHFDDTEIEAI